MISRSLTKDERKFLKLYFGSSDWSVIIPNIMFGMAIFTGLIYAAINLVVKYIIFPLLDTDSFIYWQFHLSDYRMYLILLSLSTAMMVSRKMIMSVLHFRGQSAEKIRNILKHNTAEGYTLNIVRAAQLGEWEDGGVGFFLEIDDGRVLYVQGQDLYCYEIDGEEENIETGDDMPYGRVFPSTRINFVREATIGIRLNLSSDGEPLSNILKFEGKSFIKKTKGKSEYIGPQDGEFYKGSLEDVLASFSINS